MKTSRLAFALGPDHPRFYRVEDLHAVCESANFYCHYVAPSSEFDRSMGRSEEIKHADVIIADITERDPNLLYMIGYAVALRKPIVLLSQNAEDVLLDLESYPRVIYSEQISDLRSALTAILQGIMLMLDSERSLPDERVLNQYEKEFVQLRIKDANLLQQTKELVGQYDHKALRFDVFLSYSAADYEDVRRLYEHLKDNELKVYLARKEIAGGEDFGEEIRLALIKSREIWILMTPNSLKSEWVTTEWAAGWVLKKRMVPILLRCSIDELPHRLRRVQCVDYHDVERPIARLKEDKGVIEGSAEDGLSNKIMESDK